MNIKDIISNGTFLCPNKNRKIISELGKSGDDKCLFVESFVKCVSNLADEKGQLEVMKSMIDDLSRIVGSLLFELTQEKEK